MQPSSLTEPLGSRFAHCAASNRQPLGPRTAVRLRRGAVCTADHRKSTFAIQRHGGLGVATLTTDDRCCAPDSLAAARSAHLFSLSEQENLASKLKVEVCVRTGTKFVSEQGLRLTVRVSPWEDVLCVTVCMCVCV